MDARSCAVPRVPAEFGRILLACGPFHAEFNDSAGLARVPVAPAVQRRGTHPMIMGFRATKSSRRVQQVQILSTHARMAATRRFG